ncbi:hypothetical protein [Nocardioides sp. NPDC006273]
MRLASQSHQQRAAPGVLEVDQQVAREVAVQEAFRGLAGHMINL